MAHKVIDEIKLISQEVSKGTQSILYQEVFNIGDNALRINIKSDSYDFQSHAKIYWLNRNENKWNCLHNIHYSNMETQTKLYYDPKAIDVQRNKNYFISEFWRDRDNLVEMAKALI